MQKFSLVHTKYTKFTEASRYALAAIRMANASETSDICSISIIC